MTADKLSDALCFLDDDIIEEADALRQRKKNYKSIWIKTLSAAACLCIVLMAVIGVINSELLLGRGGLPTGSGEYLYGAGYDYAEGDLWCGGSTYTTVIVRIAEWNEGGFTGTLQGENGKEKVYYTSRTVVVEFTDDTRTEIVVNDTTPIVTLAPTEEDFPVGTVVEVSYENSEQRGLTETVYIAEHVRLFKSAYDTE